MVSAKSVEEQLKKIKFSAKSWGKAEISELPDILLDDEKISECVNGTYEGGFALLVATNIRLLLIDKKPLKFLTVEDLRFDMINQIDYSHRLMGARINVSAGNKNLKFTSFNQQRLRKLINHIQHRMAEIKKELSSSNETQQQHLEGINQQLQAYLLVQHQQQEELRQRLEQVQQQAGQTVRAAPAAIAPVRPAPELADFLYAQSLLQQHQANQAANPDQLALVVSAPIQLVAEQPAPTVTSLALQMVPLPAPSAPTMSPVVEPRPAAAYDDDSSLVEAGRREIFGARARAVVKPLQAPFAHLGIEINPFIVACAKLPLLLSRRKERTKLGEPVILASPNLVVGSTPRIAGA